MSFVAAFVQFFNQALAVVLLHAPRHAGGRMHPTSYDLKLQILLPNGACQ
jgi:hypothetical protein